MNFLIDNNLPPALARALNELCKADGHAVVPLRDKFPMSTPDVHWIAALAAEGGWAVISQDKFTKGDVERRAFRESGIPIFCLAKQWGQEDYWKKAHNLVRWWPAILKQSSLISGGAAFKVSWRFTEPGKFEQIRI
ncbi:hypothetical protein H681_23125 [Pseudomonas sp. ATCC 13867]|uniref:PIN-like domain-containing protein n=1 Tax=Pseudomonas sp. ATCC 13867 TaxID=1294143 RepID=UPI0002C4F008|nr:hypothetical protein [Pseudomonas sp. ATCC 13867]AGI26492.1 hypothetical protein H681_23125 [Pseudomonas sp. ATCC 13867]RFQ21413.1 hypothetical protein D0N87_24085 [Pseudomonas sp. ATCC 13867]